jgi:hypothetical protein
MNVRFYGYYMWIYICGSLSYIERWIHYGEYTGMWFVFILAAVFFFALSRLQMIADREEAKKDDNDNPF